MPLFKWNRKKNKAENKTNNNKLNNNKKIKNDDLIKNNNNEINDKINKDNEYKLSDNKDYINEKYNDEDINDNKIDEYNEYEEYNNNDDNISEYDDNNNNFKNNNNNNNNNNNSFNINEYIDDNDTNDILKIDILYKKAKKKLNLSKHINKWNYGEIAVWFEIIGLEQYVINIIQNRIDGLLLLHLDTEEFNELGITSRLHQRKIEVALEPYRNKYMKFKENNPQVSHIYTSPGKPIAVEIRKQYKKDDIDISNDENDDEYSYNTMSKKTITSTSTTNELKNTIFKEYEFIENDNNYNNESDDEKSYDSIPSDILDEELIEEEKRRNSVLNDSNITNNSDLSIDEKNNSINNKNNDSIIGLNRPGLIKGGLTDAEINELIEDEENLKLTILHPGDDETYPQIGDIIRIHYNGYIDDELFISSRIDLNEPYEFILGINQVIKGFDRSIPSMSLGEKAKLIVSPSYGYGDEGMPPLIPPNTELIFEIELLAFWPRPRWIKPLMQEPGLSEKPYYYDEDDEEINNNNNNNVFIN